MKSNNLPKQQFVEEVFQLRLLGALPNDVARHAKEQNWNLSETELQQLAAEADRLLAQAAEEVHGSVADPRDRLFLHHFAARRALFARSMAVSDYRTALACLQDEAKLLNLYPDKPTTPTGETHMTLVINEVTINTQGKADADNDDPIASRAKAIPGK